MLKPQDIVVLTKLAISEPGKCSFSEIASSLGLSTSEAHASVKRAVRSGLVDPTTRRVMKSRFLELLLYS